MRRGFEIMEVRPTPPYRITPHLEAFQISSEPQPSIYDPSWRSWRMMIEANGVEWPIRVVIRSEGQTPLLQVFVDREADYSTRKEMRSMISWIFATDIDYLEFLNRAQGTPLQQLAWRNIGSRYTRALSIYEAILRALVWRQEKPSKALAELIKLCSSRRTLNGLDYYGTPRPDCVASLGIAGLKGAGFSQAKAETILMASGASLGNFNHETEEAPGCLKELVRRLQEIRGIGKAVAETAVSLISRRPWGGVSPESSIKRTLGALRSNADPKEIAGKLGEYSGLAYYLVLLESMS